MIYYSLCSYSFLLILLHECGAARPRASIFENLLKNDQERDDVDEQGHAGRVARPLSQRSRSKKHSNLELMAAFNASEDVRRETFQKQDDFLGFSSDSSSSSGGSSSAPHNKEDLQRRGYNITKGVAFHHNGQAVADLLLPEEEHSTDTLEEMRDLIIKHIHCATEQRDDCERLVESSSSSSSSYNEGPVQRVENYETRYVERPVQRMENDFYRMEHRVEDGMMGTLPHNTGPWPPFGIFGCGKECKEGASSFVQGDSALGTNIGGNEGMFTRQLGGLGQFMYRLFQLAFRPVQQLYDYGERQTNALEGVGVGGGQRSADGSSSLLQAVEGVSQHGLSEVSTEHRGNGMSAPENTLRSPHDLVSPTVSAPRGSIAFGNVSITLGGTVVGIIVIIYSVKKYSAKPPRKHPMVDDEYTHEPSVEPDFEPEPDPEC